MKILFDSPENPLGQVHVKLPYLFSQIAPFWHGFGESPHALRFISQSFPPQNSSQLHSKGSLHVPC